MVSIQSVEERLDRLGFNRYRWGRAEIRELPNILIPGEEIYELVNGTYEGGFALIVATDVRLILIDKKPMKYLTVEDLRFDMISEIDYSHRLFGAEINISTGSKNLHFKSYNQKRLRKLIGHVQHCMAESKKRQSEHQEGQSQHLERINQHLQAYLMAQSQYQLQLQRIQLAQQAGERDVPKAPDPVRPDPELSDYLFAQSLLAQHRAHMGMHAQGQSVATQQELLPQLTSGSAAGTWVPSVTDADSRELWSEGVREVFGSRSQQLDNQSTVQPAETATTGNALEINPVSIAFSKLPMALRDRKFGRSTIHANNTVKALADSAPAG